MNANQTANAIFNFRRFRRAAGFLAAAAFAMHSGAAAEEPATVATIAPLHSLLQNILGDSGAAHLLIAPDESPHHARLSPSRARLLQNAVAVFYIDELFERFLVRPLRSVPESARARIGGEPEPYARDEHDDHGEHDEHDAHDEHDDHDEHDAHDDHDEHDEHGGVDWHIWLDIERARQIARLMAQKLAAVNPSRAAEYDGNLRRLENRLDDLDSRLKKTLSPLRGRPFMTMHDAYRHFTRRYGLSDIGALRGGHAESLSAKRLRDARRKLTESGAVCIFGEPQLPARQLAAAAENTGVRTGVLDPLGANLTPGASLYFELMLQMGRAFSECLSPPANKN